MFDHIGFLVRDTGVSVPFFSACLKPLGIERVQDLPQFDAAIFKVPSQRGFLFVAGDARGVPSYWRTGHVPGGAPIHLAFAAPSRDAVDAFHAAALAHGGRDNGQPELSRPGADTQRKLCRVRARSRQQQHRSVVAEPGRLTTL